jgi:hypothetical protein
MQKNKIWVRHILIYGSILGLSLSLIEFVALYLGMIFWPHMGIIYIFIIELFMFLAIRKHRFENLGGEITFIESFLTGLFICMLAGLIWSVYRYFQYLFVPGVVDELLSNLTDSIQSSNVDEMQKQYYISAYKKVVNPFTLSFVVTFIFEMTMGGLFLSLFLSFLLRKRKTVN